MQVPRARGRVLAAAPGGRRAGFIPRTATDDLDGLAEAERAGPEQVVEVDELRQDRVIASGGLTAMSRGVRARAPVGRRVVSSSCSGRATSSTSTRFLSASAVISAA